MNISLEEKITANWKACRTCKELAPPDSFISSFKKHSFSTIYSVRKHKKCKECRDKAVQKAKAALIDIEERLIYKQSLLYEMVLHFYKSGYWHRSAIYHKQLHKLDKAKFAWHKCYEHKVAGLKIYRAVYRHITKEQLVGLKEVSDKIEISYDEVKEFGRLLK